MGRLKRGGYVFVTWKGDHDPRHVHVFRDNRLVLKWDLERWRAMEGRVTKRVRKLLEELVQEGML